MKNEEGVGWWRQDGWDGKQKQKKDSEWLVKVTLSADTVDFGKHQVLFTFLVASGQHPPY